MVETTILRTTPRIVLVHSVWLGMLGLLMLVYLSSAWEGFGFWSWPKILVIGPLLIMDFWLTFEPLIRPSYLHIDPTGVSYSHSNHSVTIEWPNVDSINYGWGKNSGWVTIDSHDGLSTISIDNTYTEFGYAPHNLAQLILERKGLADGMSAITAKKHADQIIELHRREDGRFLLWVLGIIVLVIALIHLITRVS